MTYDPTDMEEGLIRRNSPIDVSPIGRLTRLLDGVTDDLMAADWTNGNASKGALLRGEARGLATALSILTCYSEEEVREQVMLRWQDRQDNSPTTEETHDEPAPARTARRKRKRADA